MRSADPLNDVALNDQFFPSLSIGATNAVSAAWYDRRTAVANLRIRYYRALSLDGGVTWGANAEVTDVDSPVVLEEQAMGTCNHGTYDQQVQSPSEVVFAWADDRGIEGGSNNADVWTDTVWTTTDFLVLPSPGAQSICSPATRSSTSACRRSAGSPVR